MDGASSHLQLWTGVRHRGGDRREHHPAAAVGEPRGEEGAPDQRGQAPRAGRQVPPHTGDSILSLDVVTSCDQAIKCIHTGDSVQRLFDMDEGVNLLA